MQSPIKDHFQCNSESGHIVRTDIQSWLSVINERVVYTKLCLPEYCNRVVHDFSLIDMDILCNSQGEHVEHVMVVMVKYLVLTFVENVVIFGLSPFFFMAY